jgi:pimeloyl-ACP methyl ester carboxylesterase
MPDEDGHERRERRIRANGLRLRVVTWGAAHHPRVVLVHGGSAHARWWDFVAEALADRYHLIAPDLRGHGDSEHADPPRYGIEEYVHDLEALVTALDLGPVALVGHSLGAFIALRFTECHPELVRCLVTVDGRPWSGRGRRTALLTRLQHLPHPRFTDVDDAVRRFRLLPSATSAPPEVLRHVVLTGLRPLPDGGLTFKFDRATFGHYGQLDLSSAIAGLRCPALFVRGSDSAFVDAAALARMAALYPAAETVEIEGAHHHIMLDRPAALAATLNTFLSTHLP